MPEATDPTFLPPFKHTIVHFATVVVFVVVLRVGAGTRDGRFVWRVRFAIVAFVHVVLIGVVTTAGSRVGFVRAVRTGAVCSFIVRETAVAPSVVRTITGRDVRAAVPVLRVGAGTRVGRVLRVRFASPVVVFQVVRSGAVTATVSLVG